MRRFVSILAASTACVVAGVPAHSAPTASLTLSQESLKRARVIRAEVDARYGLVPGRKLTVSEATTTGVVESLTLLTQDLREVRTVAADNGIYFAICPRGVRCHPPHRRYARPAAAFLPRRIALELALRTFLETSATVVAISLPTPRLVLFIAERDELARHAHMSALVDVLGGDPGRPPAASLHRIVDELTRERVFVVLGLEPTPTGRDTLGAIPRWPDVPRD